MRRGRFGGRIGWHLGGIEREGDEEARRE